ncbi:DUF2384 domain-containing protein [Massilia antarctica]|uniref:DUF2384 domain-containing protein n=2 Tax=Massilia antarctica TaxID=2765360 RepID=A0AA48W9A1_9BURK|nr:antitoxin Xre/MbcA/ParS toxin-binding domain-containing protein [Massilia antarctica]QPI48252.1 DUF2384 domain-containing protein [Massilia antarctica]
MATKRLGVLGKKGAETPDTASSAGTFVTGKSPRPGPGRDRATAENLRASNPARADPGMLTKAMHRAEAVRTRLERTASPDIGENAFADLVGTLSSDLSKAIHAIRNGFPASMLKDASAYFDVPANRIGAIVRLPETAVATLVKRGANLDASVSERIWRLADLTNMAEDVFEDEAAAKLWLTTPNRTFLNLAPLDYLDTEPGAMSVRQVLNAIATGGAA